ncbi:MAG: phospho-N-acetylmuramoyl-pentapeptide-transferase, partial [Clostridiales bacterium]|nr:phospho-N-acetylmuramoyl-pentapeptide-transferase [Clostridiales bacterium]
MTQTILTILISFTVALIVGPIMIPLLQKLKFGQVVRDDGPESHLSKSGTPAMGGFIIIIATLVSVFIFFKGFDSYIIAFILAFIGFGLIGFVDDYIKVVLKRPTGLKAWQKAIMQLLLSIGLAIYIQSIVGNEIAIPFSNQMINLGWLMIPFAILILHATSNSVNLTDGLDGLASSMSLIFFLAYVVIFQASDIYSDGNLVTISAALVGACLGFLRFNTYPARV